MKSKNYLIAGVLAALLSPLLILSFFNQPNGDDFWNTWIVKQYGFAGAQRHVFSTINGRFSANIFMSLSNTFIYGSVLSYKLWPAIIITTWVTAVYRLTRHFFSDFFTPLQHISLAFFLVLVYHINMPGLHEGLYWVSSVMCYQLPVLFYIFYYTMAVDDKSKPSWAKCFFYAAYIFAAGGFNEVIAFMATITGLYTIIATWILFKNIPFKHIIFTISSALAFLLQLLSGGNLYRAGITSVREHSALQKIVVKAVAQTGYHILRHCLLSPSFWIAALVIFYCANISGMYKKKISLSFKKSVQVLTVVLSFLILFPVLLVIYIENNIAPLRVINISYFVFMAGSYTVIALYGASIAERRWFFGLHKMLSAKQVILGSLLLLAATFFSSNMRQVITTLGNSDAYYYNKEVAIRFKMIEDCKQDSCVFTCLLHQPLMLCPVDICQNPKIVQHLEKVYTKKLFMYDVKQAYPKH